MMPPSLLPASFWLIMFHPVNNVDYTRLSKMIRTYRSPQEQSHSVTLFRDAIRFIYSITHFKDFYPVFHSESLRQHTTGIKIQLNMNISDSTIGHSGLCWDISLSFVLLAGDTHPCHDSIKEVLDSKNTSIPVLSVANILLWAASVCAYTYGG